MTTTTDTERNAPTPMVRVSQFGSDAHTLEFIPGRKVGEYLEDAGITPGRADAITVNGEQAQADQELEAATAIVVTPKVSNG